MLVALALAGSVAGRVCRSWARRGKFVAAAKLGTAGFCATVIATVVTAALSALSLSPFGGAVALVLALLAARDYRFLEKLPREDPPAAQDAEDDPDPAPQDGGN